VDDPQDFDSIGARRGQPQSTSTDLDREHLAKILGLLGSTYDGEVAAAGRQADGLVRRAGLTWFDVVLPTIPLAPIIIQPPVWREPQNTEEAGSRLPRLPARVGRVGDGVFEISCPLEPSPLA
jgi:hypothetical protein